MVVTFIDTELEFIISNSFPGLGKGLEFGKQSELMDQMSRFIFL